MHVYGVRSAYSGVSSAPRSIQYVQYYGVQSSYCMPGIYFVLSAALFAVPGVLVGIKVPYILGTYMHTQSIYCATVFLFFRFMYSVHSLQTGGNYGTAHHPSFVKPGQPTLSHCVTLISATLELGYDGYGSKLMERSMWSST